MAVEHSLTGPTFHHEPCFFQVTKILDNLSDDQKAYMKMSKRKKEKLKEKEATATAAPAE